MLCFDVQSVFARQDKIILLWRTPVSFYRFRWQQPSYFTCSFCHSFVSHFLLYWSVISLLLWWFSKPDAHGLRKSFETFCWSKRHNLLRSRYESSWNESWKCKKVLSHWHYPLKCLVFELFERQLRDFGLPMNRGISNIAVSVLMLPCTIVWSRAVMLLYGNGLSHSLLAEYT